MTTPEGIDPAPDPAVLRRVRAAFRPLQLWHRHHVAGMHHIPRTGPVLLVVHHTFATYDSFLFGLALFEHTGRVSKGLGDDRIFQIPVLRDMAAAVGISPASPNAGQQMLAAGEVVGVAPGGMWEALRGKTERYQTRWGDRRGFIRLALHTGTPMVLVACRTGDDIYSVYDNPVTRSVYHKWHLPLPVVRGWGPTLLPRPVQLTHHVSAPIVPPLYQPDEEAAQVEALFAQTASAMDRLLLSAEPGVPAWAGVGALSRILRA